MTNVDLTLTLIIEINFYSNTACVIHDVFEEKIVGKEYPMEEFLSTFIQNYIVEEDQAMFQHRLSLSVLKALEQENSFECRVRHSDGRSTFTRFVITPSGEGEKKCVYLSSMDLDGETLEEQNSVGSKRYLHNTLVAIRKVPAAYGIIIALVLLFLVISIGTYFEIRQSLYEEQASNLMLIMDKMSQNMDTVVKNKWDDIHYVADQLREDEFEDLKSFLGELESIEGYHKDGSNLIFAMDENGLCYREDGACFPWTDNELLRMEKGEVIVASLPVLKPNHEVMLFSAELPNKISFPECEITRVVLVSDMHVMNEFLQVRDFGKDSETYIIHATGEMVYGQEEDNECDRINVLSELQSGKFSYRTSSEQLLQDIENEESGCVYVTYQEIPCYVAYRKLNIRDWFAINIVPAAYVGKSTAIFMRNIMIATGVISTGILIIVMMLILVYFRERERKDARIQNAFRIAADAMSKAADAQKKMSDAKTAFLASVSHDIRTPLNAILGMTDLGRFHLDEPKYMQRCMDKIGMAGQHLLALINNLLDINEVESGKMLLHPTVFSLKDNARNLENMIREQAEAKSLQLIVDTERIYHAYVFGDETRVNQIMINLASNAVKYTPEGGHIRITFREERSKESEYAIHFVYIVEDDGVGMSSDFQKIMYETFARTEWAVANQIQGTGLGLAICEQMAKLMNGVLSCNSEENVGTTFTLELELAKAEQQQEEPKIEYQKEELRGMRVIIAEDNDWNWESLSELLTIHGMEVYRAVNGQEVLQLLNGAKQNLFDVILMDVQMPTLDGRNATRMIRNSEKAWIREIPVIALTAEVFEEDIQACKDAGMNDHIIKPIEMNQLLQILWHYRKDNLHGEQREYHRD